MAQVITPGSRVVLLADRGFVDVALLQLVRDLGWHFRLRIKSNLWVYRATQPRQKVRTLMPQPGGTRCTKQVVPTRYLPLEEVDGKI